MRDLSTDFLAALTSGVTTFATCWKLTRTDSVVKAFTDHVEDLTIDGDTYTARTGYSRTAIEGNSNLAVDNMEVESYIDSVELSDEDLRLGKYDRATVEIFLVNYLDLTMGKLYLRYGDLGEVTIKDDVYTAEIRGLAQRLTKVFVENYTANCTAALFDERCQANGLGFNRLCTVQSIITERQIFTASFDGDTVEDDWFKGGIVDFTSNGGLNANRRMEIKGYSAATQEFTLFLPMPSVIAPGDQFFGIAGCDKKFSTCKDKFNNINNFRGFPLVPFDDLVLQAPDGK